MAWLLSALGLLLLAARALGGLCRLLKQPAILGEVAAGLLLGPTVLGHLMPAASASLFPSSGLQAAMLAGILEVGLVLFLFVAGLEVDLSTVWSQRRRVGAVSAAGLAVPFALGAGAAVAMPEVFGEHVPSGATMGALVLGVAFSITALPVVARTLKDLGLHGSSLGTVIIASALLNDLAGWIVFAALLAATASTGVPAVTLPLPVLKVAAFAALVLTAGRALMGRSFAWLTERSRRPGRRLSFTVLLALSAAAIGEALGLHAAFGAFLAGVAAGANPRLRDHALQGLGRFVDSVLAPIFFASIALGVDFLSHLDPSLLLWVLALACAGKIGGCSVAGRLTGFSLRESLAVGLGMNARGAMVIVLGSLILQRGLISEELFVALVGMALATSMMAGPLMRRLLQGCH